MGVDLQIRIPATHEPTTEPPLPCAETCLVCHGRTLPCPGQDHYCAPICMRTMRPCGPVHLCLAPRLAARLVIRRNETSSTYTTPWGEVVHPRPSLWPWLVVDHCPSCSGVHWHTITAPDRRWHRTAPCGLTYVLTIGALA